MSPTSRRTFLNTAALAALASRLPPPASAQSEAAASRSFLDLVRPPDLAFATVESSPEPLRLHRSGQSWQAPGVELRTTPHAASLQLSVIAPTLSLRRIHLRWQTLVAPDHLYLGDAWERSYGDLAWRSVVPERIMPWYFAAHTPAGLTHGYGVLTGAAALCFWQVDPGGVSLTLDLSNGGNGVLLGQRELLAANVITRQGHPGERPDQAVSALCRLLCSTPRLPSAPVYGTNDWYYAYGQNSAAGILRDTDLIASLAPPTGPRPFSVVDDGWKLASAPAGAPTGNPGFPDMAKLAADIRKRGVRPGIWIRPTQAPTDTPANLLLPSTHFKNTSSSDSSGALDPTIPEALGIMIAKMQEVVAWKYDLVKHDFSTYDLLGQWGFDMGASPTRPGWHFHDRTRTNAEILLAFYQALRATAGDQTLLLGCNTIGHLGAGIFELQRTGDDTSGRVWERTRRMGVNTLAFRLPQNRTFFINDADCVGVTRDIPWELNRQWLDLVARSGSALFISPAPDATGPEQRAAIAAAFRIAAADPATAYPTDLLTETTPGQWRFPVTPGKLPSSAGSYIWCPPAGCDPGPV